MEGARKARALAIGFAWILCGASAQSALAAKAVGYSLPASFFTRNCTTEQKKIVQTAATEAKRVLIDGRSDAQFIRWFGPKDGTQASIDVQNGLEYARYFALESLSLIGGAAQSFDGTVTIDCRGGRNSILAHVTGPGTGIIFLDNPYWTLPDRPSLQHVSKASVLIHELSHLAGTGDYKEQFGYADDFAFAFDLARWWPGASIFNACNHEFYWTGQ